MAAIARQARSVDRGVEPSLSLSHPPRQAHPMTDIGCSPTRSEQDLVKKIRHLHPIRDAAAGLNWTDPQM
jgi:uncharacterized NAD(P)/FAD-binding protein YdhS